MLTMQSPVRMAVIGAGHFGRFHAEKIANLPGAELVAIADADTARASEVARQHGARAVADYRELFGSVDAVSVVAPTQFHFDITRELLENDIDVLVEKPMTPDLASAEEMVSIAKRHDRILQVGHLERFSGVVEALQRHIQRPLFIESVRIAPFKGRSMDVSVILDLMIHDLDLILALLKEDIVSVDAAGAPVFSDSADIASVRLKFANACIANIVASRISLKSERTMRIFEHNKYVMVDLEKRSLRTVSTTGKPGLLGLPGVDMQDENYSEGDTLEREIAAFVTAVRDHSTPLVSGEDGRRAIEAAMRVSESLQAHAEFLAEVDKKLSQEIGAP
ncbi:MAG: Gfo/Idh/MocA family oxidoreductase [Gammaproteobacteria bacterium]|nr:Gfo/Idh/MocA family oxidoreductase [Gammaproteobacteria bacterium]